MRNRNRVVVLVSALAMLAAFVAIPVVAQEVPSGPPACPLTEGIVLSTAGGLPVESLSPKGSQSHCTSWWARRAPICHSLMHLSILALSGRGRLIGSGMSTLIDSDGWTKSQRSTSA